MALKVVALAGGVGGAKLAHGLAQVLAPEDLTIIVNVGDDFQHYGLSISPDLDTVMYTLAGIANPATGWGIIDETWQAFTALEHYGEDMWFRLGDRDLGTHLLRTHLLNQGLRLTEVTQRLSHQLGIGPTLLPATDDALATVVNTREKGVLGFQEYFVKYKWQPTVIDLIFEGHAAMSSEVQTALTEAHLVIICPSNPLLSIAPIFAVAGIRDALRDLPCVVVSPLVGGRALKGPADKLMREMGHEPSAAGLASFYADIANVLVIDEHDGDVQAAVQAVAPTLRLYQTNIVMQTLPDRQDLANRILSYVSEVYL